MPTPIYQLVILKNNMAAKMALKALPEAERKSMNEQEQASRIASGASIVLHCDSAWSDETQPGWGVIRFPSLEARIEHTRNLLKIGWLDHYDAFTLLGTANFGPVEVTLPNPIYKLWLLRSNPAGSHNMNGIPKGLNALMWEKHNAGCIKKITARCSCIANHPGAMKLIPGLVSVFILISRPICTSWPR